MGGPGSDTPRQREPVLSARSAWAILALIVIAGVVLRAYRLGERSFWYDEAFSWRLTTFSWHEMLQRAAGDVHPPLYYALLKLWSMAFGASAWAVRSFSVARGAVSIVAMYLFVIEAFGRRVSAGQSPGAGQVGNLSPQGRGLVGLGDVQLVLLERAVHNRLLGDAAARKRGACQERDSAQEVNGPHHSSLRSMLPPRKRHSGGSRRAYLSFGVAGLVRARSLSKAAYSKTVLSGSCS